MKITKTDNILNIIVLLRNTPHQIMHKKELMQALGKSRAQTYKIIAEFSQATEHRPAVFSLAGDRVILNPEFR
jgi:predicted DNA-binding transcriptional regulator AlpA